MTQDACAVALLGRGQALGALEAAFRAALQGHGSLWFVAGEAGIGKTSVCEAVAALSAEHGFQVHWGRCWEAGGAPAFWPFLQVMRSLLRGGGAAGADLPPAATALLSELLPELRPVAAEATGPGGAATPPEQARFALLDAVAHLLCEAARASPLLILLDDLHAADLASVQLLDFLLGTIRGVPLLVLASYRDDELQAHPAGQALSLVAARGRSLRLQRLGRADVAAFLRAQLSAPVSEALVEEVCNATEGNPLFLVEVTRFLTAYGPPLPVEVPGSIRRVIEARLQRLSPEAQVLLGQAAVLGREFERPLLSAMSAASPQVFARSLAEAVDAAVLVTQTAGTYRFTHILLQEVLVQGLPNAERQRLHGMAGEALSANPSLTRSPAELAHHYLAAGDAYRVQAVGAAEDAARHAEEQLAFGDAERLWGLSLSAHGASGSVDKAIALRLGQARAQMIGGEIERGRETCRQAAEQARGAGLPAALARAALAYGRVFVIAQVDRTLVALLREALAGLPPGDGPLRARVMARLAAAEQPALDPAGPIELASQAIAMARRVGTPKDLLSTLRAGCSALADLAPPETRAPLNREHESIALSLREPAEALRGAMRLSFDLFELGDIPGARAAIDRCRQYAGELHHPHFQWRVYALRAMSAMFDGRFAEAETARAQAEALGMQAGDPNVETVGLAQRLAMAQLRGDDAAAGALARALDQCYVNSAIEPAARQIMLQGELLRAQHPVEALDRARLAAAVTTVLRWGDRTVLGHLAEVIEGLGDRALAEGALAQLQHSRGHLLHNGMLAMSWAEPAAVPVARLLALLGRDIEARQWFDEAVRLLEVAGSPAQRGWALYRRGRFLMARGERTAADADLQAAAEHAAALGLHGLVARIKTVSGRGTPVDGQAAAAARSAGRGSAEDAAPLPKLVQRGSAFWLEHDAQAYPLGETKGLRMLAQLLAEPGRPWHVLDLVVQGGASDTGDAGEALDTQARDAYRARMVALHEALAEAEAHGDLGRAERAREELDALQAELARALGLGGRARRAGSAVERARVNVQRRLKDALRRVEAQDADLGRRLSRDIRTGMFCVYDPLPEH